MTILARAKFQALLRERFEFDCADLDSGIYREYMFVGLEVQR